MVGKCFPTMEIAKLTKEVGSWNGRVDRWWEGLGIEVDSAKFQEAINSSQGQ